MSNKIEYLNTDILVIGDVILDEYYYGNVERISPESPIPIFNYLNNEYRLGGAANVAHNLLALTNTVSIMSIIGDDVPGKIIRKLLTDIGINQDLLLIDDNRISTVKTRLLAQNSQQTMRIDKEDTHEIDISLQKQFLTRLEKEIYKYDLILVSDYLKGLLTESFLQYIINLCNRLSKKILIDIKGKNLNKYKGAYLLKPNVKELADILNVEIDCNEALINAAIKLKTESHASNILVTCGSNGMFLLNSNNEINHIQMAAKEVFDVTGAGDTVLAYLGYFTSIGVPIYKSSTIANVAAGIQVGMVGAQIVHLNDVKKVFYHKKFSKVISAENIELLRDKSQKIVFTNGCFDILHIGHIRYLQEAAMLGNLLIVGVNSDDSIRRLKGANRPIICENERIEMLSSLSCVDYVIKFDEDTPAKLIERIKPNIIVKGGDYAPDEVVGKDFVENNGGEVIIIPLVENKSTSILIDKIIHQYV